MELATDIAQDTFLRVWEKQFDLNTENSIGLLYKIARNLFVSHYRKDKLALNFKLNYKPELSGESPEDLIKFEELKTKYNSALAKMPEKQRTVFLMSRIDQLKYHEIADMLGVSIKAIEKRMNLALSFLRKTLLDK